MAIARGRVEKSTWEATWSVPGVSAGAGIYRYRGFRMDLAAPRRREELPALIATLMIVSGGEAFSEVWERRAGAKSSAPFRVLLCGPQTRPHVSQHSGRLTGIEVAMAPWAAHALFGIPMHELTDRAVDLTSLIAPTAPIAQTARTPRRPSPTDAGSALAARLAATPDWRARFHAIDEFLAARRRSGSEPAPQVVHAYELLRRSGGSMSITSLAESVGWKPRRLQRAFPDPIGVRPKVAARILRLQRALRLLGSGLPLARVAHECSYFDQAHLTHDIRALTGRSPRRLLAERSAMPPGPRNVDR